MCLVKLVLVIIDLFIKFNDNILFRDFPSMFFEVVFKNLDVGNNLF